MEIFKTLNFDSDYKISNYGRVIRINSRWISKRNKPLSIRMGGANKQYCRVGIKNKDCYLHRLVLEHFNSPPPKGYQAAHLDGNPLNNHIDNLKWCTPLENTRHKILHGTSGKGSKNTMAKLTESQVLQMRDLYNKGATKKELIDLFGIKNPLPIVKNRSWKHV